MDRLEVCMELYCSLVPAGKEDLAPCGSETVLMAALDILTEEHGVKVLRADCGGTLSGALPRAELVDEVSVMAQSQLIGGISPSSMFQTPGLGPMEPAIGVELLPSRSLRGVAVWLRHRLPKPQ